MPNVAAESLNAIGDGGLAGKIVEVGLAEAGGGINWNCWPVDPTLYNPKAPGDGGASVGAGGVHSSV